MRIILGLLIFLSACKSGERKDTVSFKDIETLGGSWSGKQDILAPDDSTWLTYPTTLLVAVLKDSLELGFSFKQADGENLAEQGVFYIHEDGKKLNFGPSEYNIESVKRTRDDLVIVAGKEDEDNEKQADIRLTIGIYSNTGLTMMREVKYKGTENFFKRIDLKLGRK
ncbi:MAG TPA: hypothetical protein VK489_00325 [Ferruginibacter sp.]|nr:hypothetical protein [Ferruginibacter sp.]